MIDKLNRFLIWKTVPGEMPFGDFFGLFCGMTATPYGPDARSEVERILSSRNLLSNGIVCRQPRKV